MTNFKLPHLTILLACGFLASCLNVIAHDEKSAAKSATEFARVAFVDRDSVKAHGLMAARSRSSIPQQTFAAAIAQMHPKAYPSQVTATEYEPMPGQRGMTIYLKGESDGGGEEFYYRLVMEGDSGSGYQVTGLYRGNGPHPSTAKKSLTL